MNPDPTKLAIVCALAEQRLIYQDRLDAKEAAYVEEIRELRKAVIAEPANPSRQTEYTEVLMAAIREATTPNDARSALVALRQLATTSRFSQLIGHAPKDGFQWMLGVDEVKWQTEKDALAAIKRLLKKASR